MVARLGNHDDHVRLGRGERDEPPRNCYSKQKLGVADNDT